MGLGVSLFLIAIGAILAFAVDYTASGVDINAVGWILLAVGAVGALISLMFWSTWAASAAAGAPWSRTLPSLGAGSSRTRSSSA